MEESTCEERWMDGGLKGEGRREKEQRKEGGREGGERKRALIVRRPLAV